MIYHSDEDFIGPYWKSASSYNFLMQYVGEIDHTQPGTDYQLRMLGVHAIHFARVSDKYRDMFAEYIRRNIPEIEQCFSNFIIRDLPNWDWETLKNLTLFGVTIPKNFHRDAMLRRKLTLPSLRSKDYS